MPGGQLLSTALGMTRAVTSFLGAALKVCSFWVDGHSHFAQCNLPFSNNFFFVFHFVSLDMRVLFHFIFVCLFIHRLLESHFSQLGHHKHWAQQEMVAERIISVSADKIY